MLQIASMWLVGAPHGEDEQQEQYGVPAVTAGRKACARSAASDADWTATETTVDRRRVLAAFAVALLPHCGHCWPTHSPLPREGITRRGMGHRPH